MRKNRHMGSLPTTFLIDGILLLSFLYVSIRVYVDYQLGGNSWKQGDWLINNAAGSVRRGPFGDFVISLSDILGLSPLLIVVVMQIILLAGLYFVFRILVAEVKNPKVVLLLITCPAIFVVFWVADPQGSVRKELIAFLGISLYALGSIRRNWSMLWAGVGIFCISTLAHEAMVLFLPNFYAIAIISKLSDYSVLHTRLSLGFASAFSISSLHFAIRNASLQDVTGICLALMERGLSESICDGAISWLTYDRAYAAVYLAALLSVKRATGFVLSYVAALTPLIYVIWQTNRRIMGILLAALSALPFLILYPFAVDWGRWISFHIFSLTIIIVCLLTRYGATINGRMSHYKVIFMIGLLVSPGHMIGIILGGALRQLVGEVLHRLVKIGLLLLG